MHLAAIFGIQGELKVELPVKPWDYVQNYNLYYPLFFSALAFKKYKRLGFFDHGDFTDDKLILIPSIKFGNPVISTYIDIYYDGVSTEKKATVRIDSAFISIVRVVYSTDF